MTVYYYCKDATKINVQTQTPTISKPEQMGKQTKSGPKAVLPVLRSQAFYAASFYQKHSF